MKHATSFTFAAITGLAITLGATGAGASGLCIGELTPVLTYLPTAPQPAAPAPVSRNQSGIDR